MKKYLPKYLLSYLLPALALSSLAGVAHAEWSRIDYASKELTLYIDKESHQPSGTGTMLLWHLMDYATPQDINGKAFISIKGQGEYNCEQGIRRDMMHLWHQESMGNSHMAHVTYKPGPWGTPAKGSIEQTLMRIACGK
mgnify:CR=1 FL=1